MSLKFSCPHCQSHLSAPEHAAGRTTRCTRCKGPLTVPLPSIDVEPVRASPPVNVLHVHRDGEVEPSRGHGPGAVAAIAWIFVLVASVVVCSGIGFASWQALSVRAGLGPEVERMRLIAIFLVAAACLIPAYIAARAIDRLSQ